MADPHSPTSLTSHLYDFCLWILARCLNIFFREIYPRGAWRIPENTPVLIVAAPHANQFVDSVILMHLLKSEAKRHVSFLIAEKSMKEPYIGPLASCFGALPVVRAMDQAKPGKGTISQPDPDDPALLVGKGTDFTGPEFMVGGSIMITTKTGQESAAIKEIISPDKLRLRKAFDTKGISDMAYKVAPHIDQSQMFDSVFEELLQGGCVGIFPEGGSHDRSNLLPLKAGAALMSLGVLAREPNCGLSIIPCGMNYFHAHKFRSRAVIEFGRPIHVHPDQVEAYKAGGDSKRNAVGSLLETIYQGLAGVTQISPDRETLMLVQSTRKLYNPISKRISLPLVIEFNRLLLKGYIEHEDDPRVVQLKKDVTDYNKRLEALGIKDHQVEWGDAEEKPKWLTVLILLYRLTKLLILSIGTLPGTLLFWPVFVITKIISEKKRRKALAGSVVKLEGTDVVGTWKMLVALGLVPALYTYYTVLVTAWLYYNRQDGSYTYSAPPWAVARNHVPDGMSLWTFAIGFLGLMATLTFASLRLGEISMDIIKSLPPLLVALKPWSSPTLTKLREHREKLAEQVTNTIDSLGIGLIPETDDHGLPIDTYKPEPYQSRLKQMPPSEPPSRERSRSRSGNRDGSANITGLTAMSKDRHLAVDQVNAALKHRETSTVGDSGVNSGETDLKDKHVDVGPEGKKDN